MKKDKKIKIMIKHEITHEDIAMLLNSASRGSSYWCRNGLAYESEVAMALSAKGAKIEDFEDDKTYKLTIKKVTKGLKVMAEKYKKAFADFTEGDYDMYTGDTFLQCCLFGEEIYG